MYCIRLEMFVILTMVPVLVSALPMTMVKRAEQNLMKTDNFSPLHYLVKYGHLEDKLDVRNQLRSRKIPTKDPFNPYKDEEIKNAIKSFQTSFNLHPSGFLNEEALKMMKSPRCGVPDKAGVHSAAKLPLTITVRRRRRFVKQGSKWPSNSITWTIYRYHQTGILTKTAQKSILEQAFKLWEYASPLKFTYTSNTKQADIVIQFASGYHGHKLDFDGLGNVLAHAFYPYYGGDIHFDADERWGTDINLLNVAVHEIGHSIGLQHSNVYNSMMYPNYRVRREVILDDDDKSGVKSIYGDCETKLDGAASTSGANYFFRGDLVWKIDEYDYRLMKGYPKHISDEFTNRVSTPIDTALIWSDDSIYFLYGSNSLGYDMYSKTVQYDNSIQYDWPGIPNDVDAAIAYRQSSVTYFFKGNLYWKFDDAFFEVVSGYPKKISDGWPGIPNHIDAALYSVWNNKTYFFKGTEYWEFDAVKKQGFSQGPIKNKWKNVCSAKY